MTRSPQRRLASAVVLAVVTLALAACTAAQKNYPNSTFLHNSEVNTDIIALWDRILFEGVLVFVLVGFRLRSWTNVVTRVDPSLIPHYIFPPRTRPIARYSARAALRIRA